MPQGYTQHRIYGQNDEVAVEALPGLTIELSRLLA